MRRIALYARVSTAEQTTEPQLEALRRYAEARGLEALEFVDQAQSGAKDRRPALDRMLEAVRRREVDAVAAVKLDRIARSVRHLTALAAELEALGVDLIILDQAIDTSTPSGRLLFHVLGSVAEFERDLIRDRTRAGLAAARRRGARVGRPSALEGETLARARRMLAAGQSVSHVARVLGTSRRSIRRRVGETPAAGCA